MDVKLIERVDPDEVVGRLHEDGGPVAEVTAVGVWSSDDADLLSTLEERHAGANVDLAHASLPGLMALHQAAAALGLRAEPLARLAPPPDPGGDSGPEPVDYTKSPGTYPPEGNRKSWLVVTPDGKSNYYPTEPGKAAASGHKPLPTPAPPRGTPARRPASAELDVEPVMVASPGSAVAEPEHTHSARVSDAIANALGALREQDTADVGQRDKKAYDAKLPLEGGTFAAVEVKALLKGNKDGLTMHDDALLRKVKYAETNPNDRFVTVVVDERDRFGGGAFAAKHSGHRIYLKYGTGKYTLANMHPVKDAAELKALLMMPLDELPEKARGVIPPPPPVDELAARAAAAKVSRDRRNKARKLEKKVELAAQAKALRERKKLAASQGS